MQSFFWEYRLDPAFPYAQLDYAVTDCVADGPPRLHWHNYYELGLCTGGSGTFSVASKAYPYRAGDIFVLNNLERHAAAADPGTRTRFRFFLFLPELVLGGAGAHDAELLLPFRYDSAAFCNHIPAADEAGRALRPLLDALWDEGAASRPGRARLIRARLRLALAERCSALGFADGGGERLSDYLRLRPALQYIDAHFTRRLPEADVAALCFWSESRFRRIFRQEMHMSFQEYVFKLRYLEARRLIASTEMPIAAAAREAGFSNPYYFYRLFEANEGMTPRAYRLRVRAQREPAGGATAGRR